MAQMANFLVKDDAATPKEWTFVPITDTPIPFWRTNDPALSIDGQLRLFFSEEKLKSGGYKLSAKLEVPVMETLGTAGAATGYVAPQKVAYVNTAFLTLFIDKRSTSSDRANLTKLILGIAQGATSVTATGTLNQAAAGGAFLASVAPFPALAISLVLPN